MTTIQAEALSRATTGQSMANFVPIIEGFAERGIPVDDIRPRENVFTYEAWRALGRQVRRGEHGIRVTTWVPIPDRLDPVTGEVKRKGGKRSKGAYVFHVSQTDLIGGAA
jgi:hypothetical protein